LTWDGTRWAVDGTGEIERIAKRVVRRIYREAADCDDDEIRKTIGAWARKSEAGTRRAHMIRAAQSEPGIPILPENLDSNAWLLNVENGTMDLQTGTLQAPERDHLITKQAPASYEAKARCPRWLAFLDKIMGGDEQLIGFLQRAVGYSLTGDVSERVLFILYGTGDNGKSTFLETLRTILGEYAMRTPTATLMLSRSDGIPNDVARLQGARFGTASESE